MNQRSIASKSQLSREVIIKVVLRGQLKLEKAFGRGPILFGRHPTSDVILEESYISRNHFQIEEKQDQVFKLFNLNSRNGIWFEGNFVDTIVIQERSVIQIEDYEIEIRLGGTIEKKKKQQIEEDTQPPKALNKIIKSSIKDD